MNTLPQMERLWRSPRPYVLLAVIVGILASVFFTASLFAGPDFFLSHWLRIDAWTACQVCAGAFVVAVLLAVSPSVRAGAYQLFKPHPALTLGACCVAFIALLALIAHIVIGLYREPSLVDDSYMSLRYADNLMHYGKFSWNADGPPTYGMTSNLLVLWVLPFRLLFGPNATMAVIWSSITAGAIFLCLITALFYLYSPLRGTARIASIVVIFALLARGFDNLGAHFTSGADTCLSMAALTCYLLIAKTLETKPSMRLALISGLVGGAIYSVRPDLALFSCFIPACLYFFGDPRLRKIATACLLVTTGAIVLQLAWGLFYFHSLLPLPFYIKGLHRYGEAYDRLLQDAPGTELRLYLIDYWPIIALAAAGVLAVPRRWWAERPAVEIGAWAASACFIGYYAHFVLQVLHAHQRFYYPPLPAIAFLGYMGLCRLLLIAKERSPQIARVALTPAVALPVGLFAILAAAASVAAIAHSPARTGLSMYQAYADRPRWYGLPALSRLPGHLVIATTEVGLPSAMCQNADIVDLAGLHETYIAHHGFSSAWFFSHYRPDVIYRPQAGYIGIIADLQNNPVFRENYDYFPGKGELAIAIRRDSPYYMQLRQIVGGSIVQPVGDSITLGWDESSQSAGAGGYRVLLAKDLQLANGNMAISPPIARGGYTISQIADIAVTPIRKYRPNVVLLEAGTNDAKPQYREDPGDALSEIKRLIATIRTADPGVRVYVSSLPPVARHNAFEANPEWVTAFNQRLPSIAGDAGAKYVNAGGCLSIADLGPRGVHPGPQGYMKMADAWLDAISGPHVGNQR